MKLCGACIRCLIDRQEERVRDCGNEEKQVLYLKRVARLIADCDQEEAAPVLVEKVNELYCEVFGAMPDFGGIKREYNELMLSLEPKLQALIDEEEDPLHKAFVYARAANYIDFGMAGRVEKETLLSLLDKAGEDPMDEKVYGEFLRDLDRAAKLTYVTDNCGEIVLDKLVVKELKRRKPSLRITVLVRGKDVLNDATFEDAQQTGMTEVAEVMENGCGVAGTPLHYIGKDARELLEDSDLIVAKGQGNFETMHGCGLNIYYAFLCKCDWFQKHFGMERNKGMFVRELDCEKSPDEV